MRTQEPPVTRWMSLGLLAVAVVAGCKPLDPVAVTPPPASPLDGVYAPNEALRGLEKLTLGDARGPEETAFDAEGRVYTGALDGRILRLAPRSSGGGADVETIATTGGRPLGLEFDASGRLIVADAAKGLLAVDPTGSVTVLSTEAGGVPYGFPDALDIAADGAVYFSDASSKWGVHDYMLDFLEGRPLGRLIRYDPTTAKAEVVAKDFYFSNGVALSADGDFVLVNETWAYRIRRVWLTGPKAGTVEPFVDDLPGFPDGISRSPRGTFWVALFTVRDPMGDWLAPHPTLKWIVGNLPKALMPKPKPYGFAVEVDASGRVVRTLQDPTGQDIQHVSSVHENAGALYLGTLDGSHVGRVELHPPSKGAGPTHGSEG